MEDLSAFGYPVLLSPRNLINHPQREILTRCPTRTSEGLSHFMMTTPLIQRRRQVGDQRPQVGHQKDSLGTAYRPSLNCVLGLRLPLKSSQQLTSTAVHRPYQSGNRTPRCTYLSLLLRCLTTMLPSEVSLETVHQLPMDHLQLSRMHPSPPKRMHRKCYRWEQNSVKINIHLHFISIPDLAYRHLRVSRIHWNTSTL